ncbi:hypothetical protein ACJ8VI_003953 [Providencia stuartii]|uniref:hypothetical protein n=1 Tax=Providencia stuartii TaxID=588 RepID=UPI00370C05EE
MKNISRSTIAFLLLIIYGQSFAKSVTLGPGSEVTTGKVISSKWVNYQIIDGRFIGNLEVRIRLVRGSFMSPSNYEAPYILPAQGSSITVTPCISNDAGYGGCYSNIPFPVVSCTSTDQGDINTCMNRIVGTEGTILVPVNESTVQLSSANFCMRSYLHYPEVSRGLVPGGVIGPLSLYFEPYTVCGADEGAPPPIPELTGSVCSLNSQQIELSYQSTTTNVSGLSKDGALSVLCTSGTPQNYQLKLTGNDVNNGNLNFGNGVSAQVSLNGIQVQANGPGIQLNNLVSQTIPVSATLMGNASVSGVSKATGILVLEAL